MSALVGQDPKSRAEKSLHECVDGPKTSSYCHRWHILRSDEAISEIEDRGQGNDVPRNIAETSKGRSFETVFGYGSANLLSGVVWKLEGFAKCVDELWRGREVVGG